MSPAHPVRPGGDEGAKGGLWENVETVAINSFFENWSVDLQTRLRKLLWSAAQPSIKLLLEQLRSVDS
jgi:hypothetical protein